MYEDKHNRNGYLYSVATALASPSHVSNRPQYRIDKIKSLIEYFTGR